MWIVAPSQFCLCAPVLTDSTSTLEWRNQNEGKDDPRHLWPDVFRVLQEISPKLCFFENVPGHLRLGFEQVHDDLSSLGYCVKAGLFSAAEVDASHKRERLFILAYRESDRVDRWLSDLQEIQRMVGCGYAFEPSGSGEAYVADSQGILCDKINYEQAILQIHD